MKKSKENLKELGTRFKNLNDKLRKITPKQWVIYRNVCLWSIVITIFGIYWFLKLKKLGLMLLIIEMIFMGFIIFYERRFGKMEEQSKQEEKQEKEENSLFEGNFLGDFDLGLGNAEDYQKRLNSALGA